MPTTLVNSADSHVLEPADLWLTALPSDLGELAPRRERSDAPGEVVFVEGKRMRRDPEAFLEATRPPGAYDPQARLVDLDHQGVWAEVIFPSISLWCYVMHDPVLQTACIRAYNDWVRDVFLGSSERYLGVAMLPTLDLDAAVAEIGRAADRGFRGVLLPPTLSDGGEYNDPKWDRLWAAASEAGLPVCFHIGSGMNPVVTRGPGGAVINYVETFFPAQRTVAHLVASGALDRHPDQVFVFVEGGASWLASMMERMDEAYRKHSIWVHPQLSALPSELVKRQIRVTFQHDRAVLSTLHVTGIDTIMWGSDYPHLEGTWPHTREVIDETFHDLDDAARRAITFDNLAKLFKAPAPAAA